jgi:D-3-phosphoglycerate dehydrogenase
VDIETKILEKAGALLVVAVTGEEGELLAIAPQAEAILTCFKRVSPAVVRAAPRLQVIGRYGVGVDNIAVEAATERDVIVANVPAYCEDEVAEHALALLLTLARKVRVFDRATRGGNWELATGMPVHRIRGRVLGVVGLGRIGRALAASAAALGLTVIAADRPVHEGRSEDMSIERFPIDELFARSDFVSIHAPLTAETTRLVDARRLSLMKPTAVLINTSRGGIVDLTALQAALQNGVIAGAGLDVFEPERLPSDHPLLQLDNVVVTPHVAFYSEESMDALQMLAATNVARVLSGHTPASVVNPQVLKRPRWAHLTRVDQAESPA